MRFANSLLSVPPNSLVVAAQNMRDKEKEVDGAILQFKRGVRAPIKKLCKMKSKRYYRTKEQGFCLVNQRKLSRK